MIHVWRIRIDASDTVTAGFEMMLAPEERARAARFQFDHHRCLFIITRGVLRSLVGRYLYLPPASIRSSYGLKGKPAIALMESFDSTSRIRVILQSLVSRLTAILVSTWKEFDHGMT